MYKNLNALPLFVTTALFLLTVTHNVNADSDSAHMRNLENRVNSLEQRKGASGMINPPGRPQVRDGVDLFLFGDLLCWNAHENGLSFAIVNKDSSTNLANSTVRSIHSNWNVGFRAGIGYNLPHDGWDVNFTWLRFYTHGDKHIPSHANVFVFPTHAVPADPLAEDSFCSKARSHWGLRLNQLDLDLGREFFVSKWLTLRPHFGLRTDWIRQTWNSKFRNFNDSPTPNKLILKYKDEWWGLGLEGGLDTQWGLCSGFSLFGNLSGAILYGFHDIDFEDKDIPQQKNNSRKGKFANLDNTYRISHPILDLAMGLRYDHMFYNDRFHLGFQLGWEHHIYFSQNQFPVFVDDIARGAFVSNQGDLSFQGWTLAARFDF